MSLSISRRHLLQNTACGFGSLAASAVLAGHVPGNESTKDVSAVGCHHAPRAKRIIFLFMQGGVSQVDSFDYKPALALHHGERHLFDDARQLAKTGQRTEHHLMQSPWKFRQYGETGRWASELFPHSAEHIDEMCMLHGMHTEGVAHGPATLFLHCGSANFIRPSFGSWVLYGLGSENSDLPGFVSIAPSVGNGGPRNYGSAFLPPKYQGTRVGGVGIDSLSIENLTRTDLADLEQQKQFDFVSRLNESQYRRRQAHEEELEAAIQSHELAWRMQQMAPEVMDFSNESLSTLEMYGLNDPKTKAYGERCLMARRLCESGVRFIQVNYGDNSANPAWDQHSNIPKHMDHAQAVDKPIAALMADLKQRGLLEDTIVWWGSEFGRTPYSQENGTGRDHNPRGFTVWLAGGGFKRGHTHGQTDEFGFEGVEGRVHMHDLHATLLHQLGLDHLRLTFRHAGRDYRLTDVHGRIVKEILA